MTPLESYVNARMGYPVRSRIAWQRRFMKLPGPLRKYLTNKLWKWPYRHMRTFPLALEFEPAGPSEWHISLDGKPLVHARPLMETLGKINRPVTIVASGPSSRDYPRDQLRESGRMVVAVNGSPSFLAEHGIQPDAWIISDGDFPLHAKRHLPHVEGVPLIATANVVVTFAKLLPEALENRPLSLIARVNQWHGVASLSEPELLAMNDQSRTPFVFPDSGLRRSVGWSRDPELGFFSGCTVVFAALQVVVGRGATDVEIVGMDLSGCGRSYQEDKSAPASTLVVEYENLIMPSFEIMHEVLTGTGVVVKNLSPVCPLPRKTFGS